VISTYILLYLANDRRYGALHSQVILTLIQHVHYDKQNKEK